MSTLTRRGFMQSAAAGALTLGTRRDACAASRCDRPNILFLMADQFRADCIGADGNRVVHTPHLDWLAKTGVRFTRAYSSTPTCTPARSALLTGLSPWRHGMLGYGRVAEKYPIEMPRVLRDAGYYTFGLGKMHWHPQRNAHGFNQMMLDESGRAEQPDFRSDYGAWFYSNAPSLNPDITGVGWNDYTAKQYVLPEKLHPTYWTGQTAVQFLRRYDRPEPFFMKVSFARPHSPYDPPERFWRYYMDKSMPAPFKSKWSEKYAPRSSDKPDLWHGDLGIETARHSRRGYYGSVSFVDDQIGRILDALKRRHLMDKTLIVFTADHGDMTGDHNLWRKSYAYESSARIPMLLRWPDGAVSGRRGKVCAKPVELRDVLPTFMDVAGAPGVEMLDGKSMMALAENPDAEWRPYIDLEHDICYDRVNHWNALTDGNWKYIFHAFDGSEQLFDIAKDPHELNDLAPVVEYAGKLREWRGRMVDHLAERGEEFVNNGRLALRPEPHLYSPDYPGCSCHPKKG